MVDFIHEDSGLIEEYVHNGYDVRIRFINNHYQGACISSDKEFKYASGAFNEEQCGLDAVKTRLENYINSDNKKEIKYG